MLHNMVSDQGIHCLPLGEVHVWQEVKVFHYLGQTLHIKFTLNGAFVVKWFDLLLKFYGLLNTVKVMLRWSVNLLTLFSGQDKSSKQLAITRAHTFASN